MVWLRQRCRMRVNRRRRHILGRRRQTAAFYQRQEEELGTVVTALTMDLLMMTTVQCRSIWVCNRSQPFTELISAWDDLEWKRYFCASRTTFNYLCNELHSKLQHLGTLRETVSMEKRVAITLWRLGTNVEYWTISHLFGVGISTTCNIIHKVCKR